MIWGTLPIMIYQQALLNTALWPEDTKLSSKNGEVQSENHRFWGPKKHQHVCRIGILDVDFLMEFPSKLQHIAKDVGDRSKSAGWMHVNAYNI